MSGRIAAVTRLQGCDLFRRRTAGDQDRAVTHSVFRPGQCAPGFIGAGDDPVGIEMQHRHRLFGVGDLLQRRLRATAGKARGRSADRRVGVRTRHIRFDPGGSDHRPGKAEPDAGGADRQPVIQRHLADGFEITDRIRHRRSPRQCPGLRDRQGARARHPRLWQGRQAARARPCSCSGAPAPGPDWNRASD